jgi:membrane protein implicated in regulation of membrane protease activity
MPSKKLTIISKSEPDLSLVSAAVRNWLWQRARDKKLSESVQDWQGQDILDTEEQLVEPVSENQSTISVEDESPTNDEYQTSS